jgi:4-hydroxy-3-polyprenylbenzoate decarboxylase
MAFRCLGDFLEDLATAGQLARVEAEVSPVLEVAEITGRTTRAGGPALLFGAVSGHEIPLLTNLLGTESRICRGLGVSSLGEMTERIAGLTNPVEPEGWFEKLKTAPHVSALSRLPPRRSRSGACQQVVRLGSDVDLGELPTVQSLPQETGRTITAAAVATVDAESHRQVTGRYDLVLLGPDRLGVCWAAHDDPAPLLAQYARRQQHMPLAVILGGDPTILLAVAARLPAEVDPFAVAGLLRERPIDVVACRSVELYVPAEAEIVLEGYLDAAEPPAEVGPLSVPLGRCRPPRPLPVMHVTALSHRANPVYPATVAGPPPHEACIIDRAMAAVFLPLVRMAIPELIDYDLPTFAAARHWATLSIRKTHPGQARRVAHAAWGLRQLMFAKFLVLVDEGVDVHDQQQVLAAITANAHPARDVFTAQGPPDPFDPTTPPGELGHKLAIDATAKLPAEHPAPWPEQTAIPDEIRRQVTDRWPEYGLGPIPE